MNTKIKICGLTTPTEAGWVIAEKAEYAGLVIFFEKSKRNNAPEQAKTILQEFATQKKAEDGFFTKTVAVCVSPTIEQAKTIEELGFDLIQIHGSLKEEILKETKLPIIRAVNSGEAVDELKKLIEKYGDRIEGILFDAKEPGSGQAFEWQSLEDYPWIRTCGKQMFLAGGLTPMNVSKAIQEVKPDVVDVSSGVEFSKEEVGKDREKIKAFVQNARKTSWA